MMKSIFTLALILTLNSPLNTEAQGHNHGVSVGEAEIHSIIQEMIKIREHEVIRSQQTQKTGYLGINSYTLTKEAEISHLRSLQIRDISRAPQNARFNLNHTAAALDDVIWVDLELYPSLSKNEKQKLIQSLVLQELTTNKRSLSYPEIQTLNRESGTLGSDHNCTDNR